MNQTVEHFYQKESRGTVDIDNPQFENAGRVHDWRKYIPQFMINEWLSLSEETRKSVYLIAEARADAEEWD